ncbi:MAG TPA: transcriptional repressor [Acidimicrobiales bacterium]|jgi:Fe2+ or Zn2+ uptake regulation protein|nr:transcriptional repressor [Acidimicrobiales bacterium]
MPVERQREKTVSSAGAPRESTPIETLHELVAIHLLRTDQRYTAGRQAVIELLASFARPLSISEISEAIPDVPRSSAYRHLSDLERAGVVRRIAASDEFARFELAEDLTHHHHHLLCSLCGKVIDVTPSPAFERTVMSMVKELAVQQGFEPLSHALDVIGHCAACQTT